KGTFEPLPWFTFVPMGAWLAHKISTFFGHSALAMADNLLGLPHDAGLHASEYADTVLFWGPIVLGGIVALFVALVFGRPVNYVLALSFRAFNKAFDWSTTAYTRSVGVLLYGSVAVLVVYGGLVALTGVGFARTPTGFIPQQDKGYLLVNVQ